MLRKTPLKDPKSISFNSSDGDTLFRPVVYNQRTASSHHQLYSDFNNVAVNKLPVATTGETLSVSSQRGWEGDDERTIDRECEIPVSSEEDNLTEILRHRSDRESLMPVDRTAESVGENARENKTSFDDNDSNYHLEDNEYVVVSENKSIRSKVGTGNDLVEKKLLSSFDGVENKIVVGEPESYKLHSTLEKNNKPSAQNQSISSRANLKLTTTKSSPPYTLDVDEDTLSFQLVTRDKRDTEITREPIEVPQNNKSYVNSDGVGVSASKFRIQSFAGKSLLSPDDTKQKRHVSHDDDTGPSLTVVVKNATSREFIKMHDTEIPRKSAVSARSGHYSQVSVPGSPKVDAGSYEIKTEIGSRASVQDQASGGQQKVTGQKAIWQPDTVTIDRSKVYPALALQKKNIDETNAVKSDATVANSTSKAGTFSPASFDVHDNEHKFVINAPRSYGGISQYNGSSSFYKSTGSMYTPKKTLPAASILATSEQEPVSTTNGMPIKPSPSGTSSLYSSVSVRSWRDKNAEKQTQDTIFDTKVDDQTLLPETKSAYKPTFWGPRPWDARAREDATRRPSSSGGTLDARKHLEVRKSMSAINTDSNTGDYVDGRKSVANPILDASETLVGVSGEDELSISLREGTTTNRYSSTLPRSAAAAGENVSFMSRPAQKTSSVNFVSRLRSDVDRNETASSRGSTFAAQNKNQGQNDRPEEKLTIEQIASAKSQLRRTPSGYSNPMESSGDPPSAVSPNVKIQTLLKSGIDSGREEVEKAAAVYSLSSGRPPSSFVPPPPVAPLLTQTQMPIRSSPRLSGGNSLAKHQESSEDPRENLMLAIRNAAGGQGLRKVIINYCYS